MSTTAVSASQIMDRVANLLNDPNKTDYTYIVVQPYLNMAIEEYSETMEESNSSPTNQTVVISVPVGQSVIYPGEAAGAVPKYPTDLTEIQEVSERMGGSADSFVRMDRKEFISLFPPNTSLLYWTWENQQIKFNPNGALTDREIQLRYVAQATPYVLSPNDGVAAINARAFLAFKTAAFCALFIGENENRAKALDDLAAASLERAVAISNKGRQQIMTRHRPFRAGYKARGWY